MNIHCSPLQCATRPDCIGRSGNVFRSRQPGGTRTATSCVCGKRRPELCESSVRRRPPPARHGPTTRLAGRAAGRGARRRAGWVPTRPGCVRGGVRRDDADGRRPGHLPRQRRVRPLDMSAVRTRARPHPCVLTLRSQMPTCLSCHRRISNCHAGGAQLTWPPPQVRSSWRVAHSVVR